MAKKSKEEPVPSINSIQNRDIIQRLNYMYQAGAFLQSLHNQTASSSSSGTNSGTSKRTPYKKKNASGRVEPLKTIGDLGRLYLHSMEVVGQRTTVKMDPSIKRTICKRCDVALIPGMTVLTRVEKLTSHGHAMVYTCLNCKTKRRIPAAPIASLASSPAATPPESHTRGQRLIPDTMAVDSPEGSEARNRLRTRPAVRKKRAPKPRQPLLAARKDAGHVVFCGSAKIIEEDSP